MELFKEVLIQNSLITAFVFVGLIVYMAYLISEKLTRGKFHGSALAIILEIHGEKLRGDNGEIDQEEMLIVKRALANSAMNSDSSHDLKNGYGELNVVRWSENVALELDQ